MNGFTEFCNLACKSQFDAHEPNEPIDLYSGLLELRTESSSVTGEGKVQLTFLPEPAVRFFLLALNAGPASLADCNLEIPELECSAKASVHSRAGLRTEQGSRVAITGTLNGSYLEHGLKRPDGSFESVGRVEFHLVNFHDYHGEAICRGSGGNLSVWAGRASFSFDRWCVTLDALPVAKDRKRQARETGGYSFTHIGVLRRRDGKLFNTSDACKVLEFLYWLLSFAAGARCSCFLPTGLRHLGCPVWQRWGAEIVSREEYTGTWFDNLRPSSCLEIGAGFWNLWKQPDATSWLPLAISLYVTSNRPATGAGTEMALAQAQIVLELLAWVCLSEEKSIVSEDVFEQTHADEKLRQLLMWNQIPPQIPPELSALRNGFPKADGPRAIAQLRNWVIHPTKKNRQAKSKVAMLVAYDAWQLSMWYIELVLLKLLDYGGPYNNRLDPGRRIESVPVPWSAIRR